MTPTGGWRGEERRGSGGRKKKREFLGNRSRGMGNSSQQSRMEIRLTSSSNAAGVRTGDWRLNGLDGVGRLPLSVESPPGSKFGAAKG